jgi:hypothetical protein
LRKLLMGAVAASATLALAAGAIAQTSDAELTATASPKDAGTKRKPKNTKLTFELTVDKPGTTVQTITLKLPKQLKLSGKGLGRCNFDDLNAGGPAACPAKSKAGPVGEAHAAAGPARAPVDFTVTPFVEDSNTLMFYLSSTIGLQQAIRGEITSKGRKLTIGIPPELRHPGNLDSSLTGLKQTFSAKVGRKFLVSSIGCKNKKWKVSGTLGFATDRIDGAPAPADLTSTATAKCKK